MHVIIHFQSQHTLDACLNSNLISRQRRYHILTQRIFTINEYSKNTLHIYEERTKRLVYLRKITHL